MSAIKSAVKYLADKFLTKEDLLPGLLAQQTVAERADSAIGFFKRDAALQSPGSRGYVASVQAAEDFLITHHRASSFAQLAREHVRKNSSPTYYRLAAINGIVAAYQGVTSLNGSQTLVEVIGGSIAEAKAETNFIKRRSIVRKAILAELPEVSSDTAALLTELVLSVE